MKRCIELVKESFVIFLNLHHVHFIMMLTELPNLIRSIDGYCSAVVITVSRPRKLGVRGTLIEQQPRLAAGNDSRCKTGLYVGSPLAWGACFHKFLPEAAGVGEPVFSFPMRFAVVQKRFQTLEIAVIPL